LIEIYKNRRVIVVDSIMGSGKTENAIEEMNNSSSEQLFLYITPSLNEVDRIVRACPNKNFYNPQKGVYPVKEAAFIDAIKDKRNIATTHCLFCLFTLSPAVEAAIKDAGYNLIIDETIEMISLIDVTQKDLSAMFTLEMIAIDETNRVVWLDKEYLGKYHEYMVEIKKNNIYYFGNTLVKLFSIDKLLCFKEIEILTYLFSGSPMYLYLTIHGFHFDYFYLHDRKRVKGKSNFLLDKVQIKPLLQLYQGKLNFEGQKRSFLSSSWYKDKKRCTTTIITQLRNNAYNYLNNHCKARKEDTMWTVYDAKKDKIAPRSYRTGYIACNARATNDHSNCRHLAYLVNIYVNPMLKTWFSDNGQTLKDDEYALSQMIQWIWRSAIRNGKAIDLYIPSNRMRELLMNWLNDSE